MRELFMGASARANAGERVGKTTRELERMVSNRAKNFITSTLSRLARIVKGSAVLRAWIGACHWGELAIDYATTLDSIVVFWLLTFGIPCPEEPSGESIGRTSLLLYIAQHIG